MRLPTLILSLILLTSTAQVVANPEGLRAQWRFDEGSGAVASDSSGHGHDASLKDIQWVKQGGGFAIELGDGAYIDGPSNEALGITGPVTVEAWIMPTGKPERDASLFGASMSSYLLTYYNNDLCWYIGHRGVSNWIGAKPKKGRWNHIAAMFDGERLALWINGEEAAGRPSQVNEYRLEGKFQMGINRSDVPSYEGLVDNVRVYNRALSKDEIAAHIRQEANEYGFNLPDGSVAPDEGATAFFSAHPNAIDLEQRGSSILFANKLVGLEFHQTPDGISLGRIYGIADGHDFLTTDAVVGLRDLFEVVMTLDPKHIRRDERWNTKQGLMGIMEEMAGESFPVGPHDADRVSWKSEDFDGGKTLHLHWYGIDVREDKDAIDVLATVTLREGDPLSYWRITIKNRSNRYGMERVRFPIVSLAPIGDGADDVLIFPKGRGALVENPFDQTTGFGSSYLHANGGIYAANLNMQFQALYDGPSGKGVFLGTRDPAASLSMVQIANTPSQITWNIGHFPPKITFSGEDFEVPYDCVVGPFHGDWYDATQMYRAWALKQSWMRKGPLRSRSDMPRWYAEAPLHFYTHLNDSAEGTHSEQENLEIAAEHFREFVEWAGMPLGLNLYAWKEFHPALSTYSVPFNRYRLRKKGRWAGMQALNTHDGNYPKIPALPNLSSVCKQLRDIGGMVCPYVPLEIFDQGAVENSPYAKEAKPDITRDLYGSLRVWGSEMSWQPCSWTAWWRDRLTETCVLMLQRENVRGFYLDVMQGSSLPCYWTPHGHTAAGGDAMTRGMHELVEIIHTGVKATDPDAIITGENSTEHMIDVIDGILQSTLNPENKAPIFATVYRDYVRQYGLELSVNKPELFYVQCASLFIEGSQIGMLRLRPRSNSLSFQNPEHKQMLEFLGRLVGFYRHEISRDFLAYGQLVRPLTIHEPSPMPTVPQSSSNGFSALMSSVFRSQKGELGVFLVNAGLEGLVYKAELQLERYDIDHELSVTRLESNGNRQGVADKVSGVVSLEGELPALHAVMYWIK